MSRHPSKYITRSVGAWPLLAAAASLTLTSCATPVQSVAAAPEGAGTFVAVDEGNRPGFARTSQEGHFAEAAGCLTFAPAGRGRSLTPILPSGTSFVSDGAHTRQMVVNGSRVNLGQLYRVEGEALPRTAFNAAAAGVPDGCPTSFYLVTRVAPVQRTMAGLARFCERTIICRSFGVD